MQTSPPAPSAPSIQISKGQASDSGKGLSTARFAGGSFWCLEPVFEKLAGVHSVVSGYTGGSEPSPTFEDVTGGKTHHVEAVEIRFDAKKIPYDKLLDVFWRNIDPTDSARQFTDEGPQYRTAVFYLDDAQKRRAEASKHRLEKSGKFSKRIVTEITKASDFFPAEESQQDYYKKNPGKFNAYLLFSGRKKFLEKIWGPRG